MLSRREFLKRATVAVTGLCVSNVFAGNLPNTIWLVRGNDKVAVDYTTVEGFKIASWMLRDTHANKVGTPHPFLLRLLAYEQAWFASYQYHAPIIIHSGLRTPATNLMVKGKRESEHLEKSDGFFRAADIDIPGIRAEYLGELSRVLKQGGVGIYRQNEFVHQDVGLVRSWQG